MVKPDQIVDQFLGRVQAAMEAVCESLLPPELFNTFERTTTGRNESHPRVWGICTRAAWDIVTGGGIVEIDHRLNDCAGRKFQPDLIVRDSNGRVVLAVDVESPNSSDARLLPKDVDAYVEWVRKERKQGCEPFPYLVVTMLPDEVRTPNSTWELRWSAGYNHAQKGRLAEICANPYRFWYGLLARDRCLIERYPLFFANFNGRILARVDWNDHTASTTRPSLTLSAEAQSSFATLLCSSEAHPKRFAAAQKLAEYARTYVGSTQRDDVVGWPAKGDPTSAWAKLENGYWLVVEWVDELHVSAVGLAVWKSGNQYCWPGPYAGFAVDVEGLASRIDRLRSWWLQD